MSQILAVFILAFVALTLVDSLSYGKKEIEPSPHLDGRIVGGQPVDISVHPHQISMRRKSCVTCPYTHTCGGSIYNEYTILTAAHCVYARESEAFIIVAGTNIRNGADGAVARVSKIVVHEKYNSSSTDNDVAVMFLAVPLTLNNVSIAAVELASKAPVHGEASTITGWGTTSSGGYSSNRLLEVKVPIVSNESCDKAYAVTYGPGRITNSMLCAGVEGTGGKDACQGDSGGPLLVNRKLAGIVSWGRGCALPDYPGVYSNVFYLKDWILNTIKNNS